MKIPINLASQPFRRVRAMLLASIGVSVLLVGTLSVLIALILADRAQMADVRADVARLNREIKQAEAVQARIASVVKLPANSEVLERSVFINTLLYRKAISWTRIFSDLEKTLPYNVKVVQIHPVLNSDNQLSLDMTLASENAKAAIAGVVALENSPLFGLVMQPQNQPPTQGDPLYRFRVTVNYVQKL